MKTSQNLTLINIKKINNIGKKMVKLIIEEIWLKLQKQKSKNREEELGKVMNIVIYIPEIQREINTCLLVPLVSQLIYRFTGK